MSKILETVCEKEKVDPNEYELVRNNKAIDLSLTIRFANIPNNGQLDLRKCAVKRRNEKVTLAIGLESGERKVQDFDSNHSLWDVIHEVFADNPIFNLEANTELCVIYIQKEICGEKQLRQTTLKSLGILRGRVVMKLLVRAVDSAKKQAFVESLILRKPEAEKPQINANQRPAACNEAKASIVSQLKLTEPSQQLNQTQQQSVVEPMDDINGDKEAMAKPECSSAVEVKQVDEDSHQMEVESEESDDDTPQVINYLGDDRSGLLFKMSDLPKVRKMDFPDHFYDITKKDLESVLKDLRQQQVGQNENMLETKQMKERKKAEAMLRYKSTVVRICFPSDKLIFQAIFRPQETIANVIQTVSAYVNPTQIYLYTVPPKCVLKADSTLFECNLVPAAVVHLGSNSDSNVIKDEFRDKISSYKSAANIANDSRKCNQTVSTTTAANTTAPVTSSGTSTADVSNRSSDSGPKDKKIPKWFKLN